ncbi:MAG: hypothetical protein A2045_06435 [Rhodocyclales bacterium GWA2_65_20]|nr:MAG: hypothetical protein A2045_06435 [Rhodocyclales bacterium GWA2_65_20]
MGGGVLRTTHDAELVRLTRQYAAFAGTTRNALSLISGLRAGNTITLHAADEDASFTPPTAPMGWGRVQRILNLARAGLASLGIGAPLPLQMAAALMGGTIAVGDALVRLPGVLRMYSAGADWTDIAHAFALAASPTGQLHRRAGTRAAVP